MRDPPFKPTLKTFFTYLLDKLSLLCYTIYTRHNVFSLNPPTKVK